MSQEIVPAAPIRALVNNLSDALNLGQVLAASGYFKDARTAAQCVAKILTGRELGIPPMAAMQGIYVIEGKTSLSATLIATLVQNSDRFSFRVRAWDATRCSIDYFERGEPLGNYTYTIEEAGTAGLAGKDVWKKYPKAMLYAATMRQGAAAYCPAIFAGMPVYTTDEISTGGTIDLETGEVLEGEFSTTYDPPPTPISEEQKATLNKLLRGRSGPSRIALLQNYGAANIGQLSADQADALIDDLSPAQAPVEDAPADVAEATAA